MVTLDQIERPIAQSLAEFDSFVSDQFRTDNPLLAQMMVDALSSRGKGIRPLLVMLCSALCSPTGTVTRRSYIAAMMVEMIHLTSLIHDDVIDEARLRRGRPSLNAKWQSKRAVLTGDYILARNLSIGLSSGQFDLVTHVVGAIATLCEGEVIQDDCARRTAMSRDEYLNIISKKTASLISISTSAGAKAAGAKAQQVELMREFGRAVGMAFQIQDDILDYTPSAKSGKRVYQDILEGKITLPLLIPMERASEVERTEILHRVREAATDEPAREWVINFVAENKGVELATEVMIAYITRAITALSTFPESPYRAALIDLCAYITKRDK
ncbi:MAG: polyprenyl synthetase family protein [Rikenellaceae bacterium]